MEDRNTGAGAPEAGVAGDLPASRVSFAPRPAATLSRQHDSAPDRGDAAHQPGKGKKRRKRRRGRKVFARDDHGLALRVGKPGGCCRFSCPSFADLVLVHRGEALLLPVRYFKLGKLREVETRASTGFAADAHA